MTADPVTHVTQGGLLTVTQAAKHVGVRRQTVYEWIHRDGLPVEWRGRSYRVRQSTLDTWLANQRRERAAHPRGPAKEQP